MGFAALFFHQPSSPGSRRQGRGAGGKNSAGEDGIAAEETEAAFGEPEVRVSPSVTPGRAKGDSLRRKPARAASGRDGNRERSTAGYVPPTTPSLRVHPRLAGPESSSRSISRAPSSGAQPKYTASSWDDGCEMGFRKTQGQGSVEAEPPLVHVRPRKYPAGRKTMARGTFLA